ncbi:glycosyltransferase [Lentzea sp. JNUCC 0626]|uniref:glycosyltransferase n=1 Tax=Lentzea sp. JNUCC 0626 TaxID=3367513 RepID=UPI003748601E
MAAGTQGIPFDRMRIALVSEHSSPLAAPGTLDSGSQNLHVAELATALAALGHKVAVYTRRDDPHVPQRVQTASGYEVVHVNAGPAIRMRGDDVLDHTGDFVQFLKLAWKARRPDVVHAHGWLSGIAAVLSARNTQVPVVQTYHRISTATPQHRRLNGSTSTKRMAVERLVGHEAARIVATCQAEARDVLGMGVDKSKLSVVPRGVDLNLFCPPTTLVDRLCARRVVSVGRVMPRKGFEETIRALSTVEGVELVIAGGGAQGDVRDEPETRRLIALAEYLGVASRLVFAGHLPHAELPVLLRSADVVVCAPRQWSSGCAALEAMACGTPVVATSVGGLTDAVVDGVTGVLVPSGKPDGIAKALRGLLADGTQRTLLSAGGQERARARYSWHRCAADLVRIYTAVSGKRTAGNGGNNRTIRSTRSNGLAPKRDSR